MRACEMDPQWAAREGENRCSMMTKTRHSTTDVDAYMLLIRNIITRVPTRPMSAVCQVKYLNDGL
jgi:hypothetical protein